MTRQAACLSTDEDDNIIDSAELSISANADRIAQTSKKTIQSKSTKIGKEQKHDYKVIFDLLEELSGKLYICLDTICHLLGQTPVVTSTVCMYFHYIYCYGKNCF